MAPELSSNWKKLQAKIKAESITKAAIKRKASEISEPESGKPRKKRVLPTSD
jgi:RNA exonuclease 4